MDDGSFNDRFHLLARLPDGTLDEAVRAARRATRAWRAILVPLTCDGVGEVVLEPDDARDFGPAIRSLAQLVRESGPLGLDEPALRGLTLDGLGGIEAFLGVPVLSPAGAPIAVLCAIDMRPRAWDGDDLAVLGDAGQRLTMAVALARETEARRRAEAAAARIRAKTLAVADTIPGLVFERRKVGPADSRYTFFGSSTLGLPGLQDLVDGDVETLQFVHREDRARVREALRRTTLDETDLELTFRAEDDAAGPRWLRSRSSVRRESDGGVVWDGLCFDVTDLMEARHAAEAAQASTDMLLTDVNHELRAPLQAIIGFANLLLTETRPEAVRAHATVLGEAGRALLAIVNQLLDLVGRDAAPVPEPVAIRTVVETCCAMVFPLVDAAIVPLFTMGPDLPDAVLGDRMKIQQVLLNLLNNAVKFTRKGTITLRVEARQGAARFAVEDTGIGIPEEQIGQLFQRFSRLAPDVREGTGLGLAIAKAFTTQMGGAIGAERNAAGGMTFWFDVPLAPDRAAPLWARGPTPIPMTPRHGGGNASGAVEIARPMTGLHILVADDLDLNRRLIADMLSLEGHDVDCVCDGAEAVEALNSRSYDLVLMDMIMPVMDGLAATRAIRALPAPVGEVPIIAMTAHSFREQLDSCLAAGMDATLTKPMSMDALVTAIRDRMGDRSQAA